MSERRVSSFAIATRLGWLGVINDKYQWTRNSKAVRLFRSRIGALGEGMRVAPIGVPFNAVQLREIT